MTKSEAIAIVNSPLASDQQKAAAQSFIDSLDVTTTQPTSEFQLYCDLAGYDVTAELLARHARGWADPVQRHKSFEALRESWKNNAVGMKSFTIERENLPQERRKYD